MSHTKPRCRLSGEDGNAFAIIGRVTKALRQAGQGHLVKEFQAKATSGDYNHLLAICLEYVDDSEPLLTPEEVQFILEEANGDDGDSGDDAG